MSFLCWRNRNTKKKKPTWKRAQNPIKIVFFEVVIQKCEKYKKLPDTICVRKGEKRAFSCRPKQCKPGNTIKVVVSAEIAQNQK